MDDMPEPLHPGKFSGPITFRPPDMDSILGYLGVLGQPEHEQRKAVLAAVSSGDLGKLEIDVLREQGWLDDGKQIQSKTPTDPGKPEEPK